MQHRLNMHEAKTHLSRYLSELQEGDVIILCRRNQPIAEVRPLPRAEPNERPIGLGKGTMEMSDSFFEPLPDEMLDMFEGTG
ncbi:MAG: type II toxin-antitoxin system Phd/YefM family antitoxin [Candidatus Eremiobacteraeota bacterium]|nr:type II toxin-antitoxin system Phd/YefM family antitoxin [Candidatus Eremiobacteraeota bacterium]